MHSCSCLLLISHCSIFNKNLLCKCLLQNVVSANPLKNNQRVSSSTPFTMAVIIKESCLLAGCRGLKPKPREEKYTQLVTAIIYDYLSCSNKSHQPPRSHLASALPSAAAKTGAKGRLFAKQAAGRCMNIYMYVCAVFAIAISCFSSCCCFLPPRSRWPTIRVLFYHTAHTHTHIHKFGVVRFSFSCCCDAVVNNKSRTDDDVFFLFSFLCSLIVATTALLLHFPLDYDFSLCMHTTVRTRLLFKAEQCCIRK